MPEIRKGRMGEPDGGSPGPVGDGGNIGYPKRDGTSADKEGGVPELSTGKEGLNTAKGDD